jgi:hypothetical protein
MSCSTAACRQAVGSKMPNVTPPHQEIAHCSVKPSHPYLAGRHPSPVALTSGGASLFVPRPARHCDRHHLGACSPHGDVAGDNGPCAGLGSTKLGGALGVCRSIRQSKVPGATSPNFSRRHPRSPRYVRSSREPTTVTQSGRRTGSHALPGRN